MSQVLILLLVAALFSFVTSRPAQEVLGHDAASLGRVFRTLPTGRTFLLHVPPSYDPAVPHPIVFSFHGAGGYSLRQEMITQLSDPALRIHGLPILAVYPQGVNNTDWSMDRIWQGAPYGNITVDDVQYVKDMIEDIEAKYTVDPLRRYACGKSNGGGFTNLLACRPDTSLLFAAFAPVSPALYPGDYAFSDCEPSRPVPILHSHGIVDQDTLFCGRLPFPRGHGFGPEPDVRVWRRQWAARNGCKSSANRLPEPSSTTHPYANVTEEVWDCDAEVRALSFEHLGHAWPTLDGRDTAGSPNATAAFEFTPEYLIPFFDRNPMPE